MNTPAGARLDAPLPRGSLATRLSLLLATACGPVDGTTADKGSTADSGAPPVGPCDAPWSLVRGGPGPDTAWGVAVTGDGDVLLAAHEGEALATDLVVRRLAADGAVRWETTWDSGRSDEAFVVVEAEGTAWVGGLTRSGDVLDADTTAVLVRFDARTGAPIGDPFTWDSPGWDELDGIGVADGRVVLSGWTAGPAGGQDVRVVSLSSDDLAPLWDVTFGTSDLDAGNGQLALGDGVAYVGASWASRGVLSTARGAVLAVGIEDGTLHWMATVGDGRDYREILGLTSDGERVYAAGWAKRELLDWELRAWAFEAVDGAPAWEATWDDAGIERSRALAVDGSTVLVAGTTNSVGAGGDDVLFLRLDAADGRLLDEHTWGGAGNEGASGVAVDGDRVFVAGPTTSSGAGETDALLLGACHRPWRLPPAPDGAAR